MTRNVTINKLGYRPSEAAFALGSEKLLTDFVNAGWLRPIIKRHKLTIYGATDLLHCWSRLIGGEVPGHV